MRIRELPLVERPASRLVDAGPNALSDAELLALVSGQQDLAICERSLRRNVSILLKQSGSEIKVRRPL